jgi:hypothetical protein
MHLLQTRRRQPNRQQRHYQNKPSIDFRAHRMPFSQSRLHNCLFDKIFGTVLNLCASMQKRDCRLNWKAAYLESLGKSTKFGAL